MDEMTTLYIVHWSDVESADSDDTGADLFPTFVAAYDYLVKIIAARYPDYKLDMNGVKVDELVDPEALFPYHIMITKKVLIKLHLNFETE
jgi:hypothetical protein